MPERLRTSVAVSALSVAGALGIALLVHSIHAVDGGGRPMARASEATSAGARAQEDLRKATFAGGCFWCMEPPFEKLDGVQSVVSGYTGGHVEDPSYEQVSAGGTGHLESVQVTYDPKRVKYETLLDVFWRNIDPTDAGGQFCDRGHQYTTAIFYHTDRQQRLAEASKRRLERSDRIEEEIATEVRPAEAFYRAEEYHQDYYKEHRLRYKFYRWNCGRDERLQELWGEKAGGPAG